MGNEIEKDLDIILPLMLSKQNKKEQAISLLTVIVKECDVKDYMNEIIDYICTTDTSVLLTNCLEFLTYKYPTAPRFKLEYIISKLYTIVQT